MVTATPPVLDPQRLRHVFGAFPSGVAAVAALVGGVPVGIAASSFTSVSLDPPLVSLCVAHTSTTWPLLRGADRLGVSILGEAQDYDGPVAGAVHTVFTSACSRSGMSRVRRMRRSLPVVFM